MFGICQGNQLHPEFPGLNTAVAAGIIEFDYEITAECGFGFNIIIVLNPSKPTSTMSSE
jgi:hypothetical protein